jgi:hypothetical protein
LFLRMPSCLSSKTKLLLPFSPPIFFCYFLSSHSPLSRGNHDFCQEKRSQTHLTALSWKGGNVGSPVSHGFLWGYEKGLSKGPWYQEGISPCVWLHLHYYLELDYIQPQISSIIIASRRLSKGRY